MPGATATLVFTDATLLTDGQYILSVRGRFGEQTALAPITLTVNKPGFSLQVDGPRLGLDLAAPVRWEGACLLFQFYLQSNTRAQTTLLDAGRCTS